MTSVEQLIGNLLLRHNCVIIPSFGGFVAKRVSARIDYNSGTMLPPSKSILFNRQLLNNDGLLINEYARENSVSYEEAAQEMNELVQNWQSDLKKGGRIEIERVGNLFYDDERNICFEQDRFANLLLESFGLGSVHFVSEEDVRMVEQSVSIAETLEPSIEMQPKSEIAPEPEEKKVEQLSLRERQSREKIAPIVPIAKVTPVAKQEKIVSKEETPKRKNRAWRYIAAACILPVAFYSVWIPVKTDVMESGMLSFSDFNPFHQRTKGTYTPSEKPVAAKQEVPEKVALKDEVKGIASDVYSYKFTDDTYISVALPEKEAEASNIENGTPEPNVETPDPSSNNSFNAHAMHYVVGCFGDKENADNLVAKLRANGLDAKIVDVQGGLHRVSAGGAISEESYQTIKLKADAMGLSGWRLR
ncbi:MAG: hypothetical protein Crog4KO_18530 [Crocinitomicaceae bacterium]